MRSDKKMFKNVSQNQKKNKGLKFIVANILQLEPNLDCYNNDAIGDYYSLILYIIYTKK
jgi:hypothetical protein